MYHLTRSLLATALIAFVLAATLHGAPLQAQAAQKQNTQQTTPVQTQKQKTTTKKTDAKATTQSKQDKSKLAANAAPKKNAKKKTGSTKKVASRRGNPAVSYRSCVVFNVNSNKIIFSSNPNEKIPPASLTKILSMYVAEDAIRMGKARRTDMVTVSQAAAWTGGSRMGLRKGDKVSLDDLLKGMAVSSGNDASLAVAEYIGGTERQFVQMMNRKARALGMTQSTFKNCNGLPAEGQFTTARDMLILGRKYIAAYPGNLQRYHNQPYNTYRGRQTRNSNPLLHRDFEGADGLKTGFVNASGYNLIATAKRGKERIIGVILGCPSGGVRAREAIALMEKGFASKTFAQNESLDDAVQTAATEVTIEAPSFDSPQDASPATAGASTKKTAVAAKPDARSGKTAVQPAQGKRQAPASSRQSGSSAKTTMAARSSGRTATLP